MKVFVMLICLATACYCQNRNRPADARTLLLSDQELRFAGYALQTVFSSNPNAYVSSSTIASIQKKEKSLFYCALLFHCCHQLEKSKRKSAIQRHIYDRWGGLRRFGHSNKRRCGTGCWWYSNSCVGGKLSRSTPLRQWLCEKIQLLKLIKKIKINQKMKFSKNRLDWKIDKKVAHKNSFIQTDAWLKFNFLKFFLNIWTFLINFFIFNKLLKPLLQFWIIFKL
jgi:hypothetical protein